MIESNGKNDFKNNVFDKYRWSANTYEYADEIIDCLKDFGVFKKKVKGVSAIGAMLNHSLGNWESRAVRELKDSGIIVDVYDYDLYKKQRITLYDGSVYESKDYLSDHVAVNREVFLDEPLLIIFEDGDVLELLPCTGKGLRIGMNTLPKDMRDGTNRCEFNVGVLFDQYLTGNEIYSLDVFYNRKDITSSIARRSAKTLYCNYYELNFPNGELILKDIQCNKYEVTFSRSEPIRCSELYALGKRSFQIGIYEGWCGGGSETIVPVKGTFDDNDQHRSNSSEITSVIFSPTLFVVQLTKYFDPELEINKKESQGYYDYYYSNYYTKETIVKMVEETLEKLDRVRALPIHEQKEILKCGYRGDTAEEELLRVKEEISFTERFCERLLGMANNNPEYDCICFAGP